jgi:hypothetical protein
MSRDEGFLSRWSRRKADVKSGVDVPAEAPAPPVGMQVGMQVEAPVVATPPAEPPHAPQEPPPTLEDVAKLTPGSDFRRFVAPSVDPAVKNAAMKKLFADPRFNVMDGLDTYIDDYGKPDPIPQAMLRRMVQSTFLGLFDDEAKGAQPKASPNGEAPSGVPESIIESEAVPPDEDTDLRLQQHDAAGPGGNREGPPD